MFVAPSLAGVRGSLVLSNQLQQAAAQAAVGSLLALEGAAPAIVSPAASGVDVLAGRVVLQVESLVPRGRARCIDLAPGAADLAEAIRAQTDRAEWHYDDARDGAPLPYADSEFDVALLCDVLRDDHEDAERLLIEARRVADFVLVKDRFADRARARSTLPREDIFARSAHGVLVPSRCFTREAFVRLAADHGLRIAALDCYFDLYRNPIAGPVVRPGCDFLAVLSRVS
jgi:hypothetical protein